MNGTFPGNVCLVFLVFRKCLLACGLAGACATFLLAQSERGTIAGTVTDSSGAIVPGARVSVTNSATNATFNTTTAEGGTYTAPSLAVGQYTVRVDKEGFKAALLSGITVNAATNVRADFTLDVGTAQQTVEIKADVQQLTTESAKSSVTITNKLVDELPLVVGGALRSPFDLAALTPEGKNFGGDRFSVGGGQSSSYGVNLDGVSAATTRALQVSWINYNAPSLEAITEFTVDTNGFKAEYGHATGGLMSFSSKSGTNDFHGSAYEFLRNDKLDARRFFEAKRGVYKQHDFGFSFGGPILIPKIYNGKNKSFFFVSYEGFRNRVGANSRFVSVPTPEMYSGDFSKWVNAAGVQIPVYDPGTTRTVDGVQVRDPFPGNQINSSRFDPLAVKLAGVYASGPGGQLKPNLGGVPGTSAYVRNNYAITSGTETNPWTKLSLKGDHIFSEKDRLSGYFGYNRIYLNPGPNGPNTLPGYYTDYNDAHNLSDVYRMSWDHNFTPTLLNHFYAGGNNWREGHYSPNELINNWKDKFCLPNVPICNNNLSALTFSEFAGWGGPSNNGSENTVYSFNNDTNWIKGRHSIKFGGMYQRNHYNGFGQQWDAGTSNFVFTATGRPNDGNFATAGGNSFASFLLGRVNDGQIHTIRFIGQQWPYYAGYVQDDFRVNSKLTINYGIRWETTLPPVEAQDRWSDFSPTRQNPAADNIPGALIYAGTGEGREGTRSLADSYFRAFGPRLGFAYSMNSKTVLRASLSRSFGAITTVTGSTHQRGFTLTTSFPGDGINPAYQFQNGPPPYALPPFISPSFANRDAPPWWQGNEATKPPTNYAWTLSMQRQLTPSLLIEGTYNALIGARLQANLLRYNQLPYSVLQQYGRALLTSNINSPAAVAAGIRKPFAAFDTLWGSQATVAQALRPYPQYADIDTTTGGGDHSGHSSYHAAIVRLEKRAQGGLTFQTSYVLSKLITDADSYWASDFPSALDHFNRSLEKSIGAYDVTHNFKLGLIYELPFGRGKNHLNSGVGSIVLGGWRVSSTHFYSSGQPVAITSGIGFPIFSGRTAATVSSYDNWAGSRTNGFDPQVDRFFAANATFGVQPQNVPGNSTRYNPKLRQFPNFTENISVAKTFALTERMKLDFRWEAFNLFNRVRFGTGSNSLSDPNFGLITGNGNLLNDPRRMQFALKLNF